MMNTQAILDKFEKFLFEEFYDYVTKCNMLENLEQILTAHEGETEVQITKRMIEGWVNRHPTEISVREEECARSIFSWLEGRE